MEISASFALRLAGLLTERLHGGWHVFVFDQARAQFVGNIRPTAEIVPD